MAVIGKFTGKCCDSNVFNNNDMHLGLELFEKVKASQEYKDAIERGHYIGFLGHPEDPACQEFQNGCIVMKDMSIEPNGEITGEFDLIDTPVGLVVKSFIDAGVKFGISIRGAGDVANDGEVSPDEFIFRGFDLVAFPAYNDCVPEFKAIAASTDTKKKAKYLKACAVVKENLKNINSTETLDIIKDQFAEDTDEYAAVNDRIAELTEAEEVVEPISDVEVPADAPIDNVEPVTEEPEIGDNLDVEKLNSVTTLYIEALNTIKELQAQLDELTVAHAQDEAHIVEVESACDKKIASATRMMNNQLEVLATRLKTVKSDYQKVVASNNRLTHKLKVVEASNQKLKDSASISASTNLKYQQKIESANDTVKAQDLEISKLQKQLRETVTASSKTTETIATLQNQVRTLRSKVESADNIILDYQKAYANIYANALGVSVEKLPITASTSVAGLQELINASCNTCNIPARADMLEPVDIIESLDDSEFDDGEIISL